MSRAWQVVATSGYWKESSEYWSWQGTSASAQWWIPGNMVFHKAAPESTWLPCWWSTCTPIALSASLSRSLNHDWKGSCEYCEFGKKKPSCPRVRLPMSDARYLPLKLYKYIYIYINMYVSIWFLSIYLFVYLLLFYFYISFVDYHLNINTYIFIYIYI